MCRLIGFFADFMSKYPDHDAPYPEHCSEEYCARRAIEDDLVGEAYMKTQAYRGMNLQKVVPK